jgi:hypothetical protein
MRKRTTSHPPKQRSIEIASRDTAEKHRELVTKEYELGHTQRLKSNMSAAVRGLDKTVGLLETDKTNLAKRLSASLAEVDRLTQDKAGLSSLLQEERQRSMDLERKVKHSGRLKHVVDRNMQGDLKFERDENQRLQNVLHTLDVERAELRAKLKDFEVASVRLQTESHDIGSRLTACTEHLASSESDTRGLFDQLKSLQAQVAEYENEHSRLLQERAALQERLAELEGMRASAILQADEECIRLQNFSVAMRNEKDNLAWVHRRHSRLLAARSLFLRVSQAARSRLRTALQSTSEYAELTVTSVKMLRRLAWVMQKYGDRRSKRAVDTWRSILNWTSAAKSRDALLDTASVLRTKTKAYSAWQTLFIKRTHSRCNKDLGFRTLIRRTRIDDARSLRRAWGNWMNLCNFTQIQGRQGVSLAKHVYKRLLQRGLYAWWEASRERTACKQREGLAEELATNLFKQAVFYDLRQAAAKTKADKERMSFSATQADAAFALKVLNAWASCTGLETRRRRILGRVKARGQRSLGCQALGIWKRCLADARAVQRTSLMISRLKLRATDNLHGVCFAAWKSMITSKKAESAQQAATLQTTKRQGLEAKLEEAATSLTENSQRVAIRAFRKLTSRTQGAYFDRWVSACSSYDTGLRRCKTLVVLTYLGKVESAFRAWQQSKLEADAEALQVRTEEMAEENEALVDHVNNLEAVLALRQEEKEGYAANCTHRCLLHLARFSARHALRRWASNALRASAKELGLSSLETRLSQTVLTSGFQAIKAYSVTKVKLDNRKARLQHHVVVRWRNSLVQTFLAWQASTATSKLAKGALSKLLKRKRLHSLHDCFQSVSINAQRSRAAEAAHSQQALALEHARLAKDISTTEADIQHVAADNAQAARQLTNRASKRLLTALKRSLDTSQSRALSEWKEFTVVKGRQERTSNRLNEIWGKQYRRKGLRAWQAVVSAENKAESEARVSTIVEETTFVRKEMKALQSGRRETLQAKQDRLRELEVTHAVEHRRLETLLDRHVGTSSAMFEISKAHWCLRGWARHYRLQKRLLLRVKALTLAGIYRKAFRAIKDEAKDVSASTHFSMTLERNFDNFGRRKLSNGLSLLRSRGVAKVAAAQIAEAEAGQTDNSHMQQLFLAVQRRTCAQGSTQAIHKKQSRLLRRWHKAAAHRATLRRISVKLIEQLQAASKSRALENLKTRATRRLKEDRGIRVATGTYLKNLLSKAFRDWKYDHRVTSYINDVFVPLGRKHSHQCLQRGFAAIQAYSATKSSDSEWVEGARMNAILRIGKRLQNNQKAQVVRSWKASKEASAEAQQSKKLLFGKALTRFLRQAWDRWKELSVFKTVVWEESISGQAGTEQSHLAHREEILLDIARHEGLDVEEVQMQMKAAEHKQQGLIRNAVTRLRYLAGLVNDEDSTLKPKCFSTWKDWALRRKACKAATVRLMGYVRFPAAKRAFNKWKNGLRDIEKRFQSLPKAQLAGQIAAMDREIRSLEAAVESQDITAKYLTNYCEILQTHTMRGLRQALSQCHSRVTQGKRQAYSTWALCVSLWKARELHLQIEDTEEQIGDVAARKRQVYAENEALSHENEELRQASLDGIAIADAIETLSRERERLSVDLADRATTIKQLIDENNSLALKLKSANLPERDVPRRYAVHHPS